MSTIVDHSPQSGATLAPSRAYARLMALSTLLDDERGRRAREAITVLADAPERVESEAA